MSTKQFAVGGVKAYGMTMDQYPIYKVGGGNIMEELLTTATTPSISPPYNSNVTIDIKYSHNDAIEVKEYWFDMGAVNSSDTVQPTFLNEFEIFSEARLLFNNTEVDHIKSQNEVALRVSNYVRDNADDIDRTLALIRNETAYTFNGLTFGTEATTQVSLPMTVLFPILKNLVVNEQTNLRNIRLELTFSPNPNSAGANTRFVKSNTTANAYGTNLTYSNIQIRQEVFRPSVANQKLMLTKIAPKLLRVAHDVKHNTVDMSTVDVNVATIKLSSDFSSHSNCRGIHLWFDDAAERTAFNDADACIKYSGASFLGYKILKDGKVLIDHSRSTLDLKRRKASSMATQKRIYSHDSPVQIVNASDNLSKYYWVDSFIDFQNIETHSEHDVSLAGINSATNIEIEVYVGSVKSSAVTLYSALEYVEEITHKNGDYVRYTQL